MKLQRLIAAFACSLGTICFAQESSQPVPVPVPTQSDFPPSPPGLVPLAPGSQPPAVEISKLAQPPVVAPPHPPAPITPATPLPPNMLAWDSETKDYNVKPGEAQAQFTFYFTNISTTNIVINSAVASCGCTVPKMPSLPWTNAPGATGEIPVTMNLAGKSGTVFKTITVNTDHGPKLLTVKAIIPPPQATPGPVAPAGPMDRNKNQELAKADRQAVFKGDCANCHVEPARGRMGKELYDKACGICHEAEHRATMVPDLHALNHDTNADFWKTWTSQGKPGSLMPAFALSEGGPLNETQINSLVQYLTTTIPAHAVKSASAK